MIAPRAAPEPEKSAAPNSTSRILRMNTAKTVNGIESIRVGRIDTRAMNQVCKHFWVQLCGSRGGCSTHETGEQNLAIGGATGEER